MRVQRHTQPGKDYEAVDAEEEVFGTLLNIATGTVHPQSLVDETHILPPDSTKRYHLKLIKDSLLDLTIEAAVETSVQIRLIKADADVEPAFDEVIEIGSSHSKLQQVSDGEYLLDMRLVGDTECEISINVFATPRDRLFEEYNKNTLEKITIDKRLPWSEDTFLLFMYNGFVVSIYWSLGDIGSIFFLGLYGIANILINPVLIKRDINSARENGPFPWSAGYSWGITGLSAFPLIGVAVAALHIIIRSRANKFIDPY